VPSSGPRNPATFANDASIGIITWTNVTEVASSDGSAAFANNGVSLTSKYLKVTNFGFSLAAGVTVDGIEVEVERRRGGAEDKKDLAVRIVKGDVISSTDMSSADFWPSSFAYKTYGSSSSLWGETWAYSDINSSTFGFAIAAQSVGEALNVLIEHIRITAHYSAAGAGPVFQRRSTQRHMLTR
jgi:hypothetical protein